MARDRPSSRASRVGDARPLWPAEIARDVDEELASHLELRREEYAAQGLAPPDAAAAAAKKFGNRDAVAEACRLIDRRFRDHERRTGMLTDLRQDLGYALRLIARNPGFAAIAVATLAIGIGATSTIFTLANWALLRPVPGISDPSQTGIVWVGRYSGRGFTVGTLSYPNLADANARLQTISLGAYQGSGTIAASGGGQGARNLAAQYVTASYFEVLGVRMQLGRPFTAVEDTPPSPFLGAVISDRLWHSMFHRDPNVLQQPLDVAGVRFAILGVAPPGFHGTERLSATDLFLPGSSQPIVRHMPRLRYDARSAAGFHELVARLEPGATWPQAQAELDSLRAWLREQYPGDNETFRSSGFSVMGAIGPPPLGRDRLPALIGLMAAASALVMLIACANVAGLLTIRGVGRRNEIAVRKALGAGRWRLVRQQLAEGMLLWIVGGGAGLGVVLLLRRAFDVSSAIGTRTTLDMVPPIDWRVLSFTLLLSLAVGLIFTVMPALRATRAEAAETLRSTTPAATRRMFVGTSLAVFQLAASLTLLLGALLLAGTLRHLARVPLGFDADGLYVFSVRPASIGYGEEASLEYLNEFERRLGRIPGVRGVTAADGAPFFAGMNMQVRLRRADAPESAPLDAGSNIVFLPKYFETIGIPIVGGRSFTEADLADGRRGESRVIMVSDGLGRRLFGDADPVGREVEFPQQGRASRRYRIVGIAGTARYSSLVANPEDMIYEPAPARRMQISATVIVRTSGPVMLAAQARGIAAALNPALPLTTVLSMSEAVGRARREWDTLGRLLVMLAAAAAVLACVGLYGVIAHGVAARRREFGIRVALGASRSQVWRLVARQTAAIAAAGLTFGFAGGAGLAQLLRSRLVGVHPFDPLLWALAAGGLVLVAAIAAIKPARAATSVDVTETLRAI